MTKKLLSPFSNVINLNSFVFIILLVAIVMSSLSLVLLRHQHRMLFAELAELNKKRDSLHIAWSQLLLERGTLAAGIQVEEIASKKLAMKVPDEPKKVG